ncbi:MAG: hypothetical protein QOF39_1682, partial [Frankiales bacterium]|nr:hypothetical protein [Frankiales bacterium]
MELAEVAQVERREAMPVASSLSNLSVGNTGAMSGDARPEARLLVVDDEPNIVEL